LIRSAFTLCCASHHIQAEQ